MAETSDGDRPSTAPPGGSGSGRNKPLTNGQRRAARKLALGERIVHVARVLRVSPRTIFEWRRNPEFQAEEARWVAEDDAIVRGGLKLRFERALETLDDMSIGAEKDIERIMAASKLADLMVKIHLARQAKAEKLQVESPDDAAEQIRAALREMRQTMDPDAP